MSTNGIHIQNY